MHWYQLAHSLDTDQIAKVRRASWDQDCYIDLEAGSQDRVRVSFTFAGPITLTSEDTQASDWEFASATACSVPQAVVDHPFQSTDSANRELLSGLDPHPST